MFDLERDQLRKTYQLCRLGFGFIAVAMVLFSLDAVVDLFSVFHGHLVDWVRGMPWYARLGAPIVWGKLMGAVLLWGRWDHVSWQRRSGLLVIICLADLGLWFADHGEAMGIAGEVSNRWFREHMSEALSWGEFALLSSLSCDYLVHLGVDHARDSDKSTRSMAVTGALVWMLFFCQKTNWAAGWPLQKLRIGNLESELLSHGWTLIWTITAIQVTALAISAARQSSHVLFEMDREDQQHDLLPSRSDSYTNRG
jgi:hypothetical protein